MRSIFPYVLISPATATTTAVDTSRTWSLRVLAMLVFHFLCDRHATRPDGESGLLSMLARNVREDGSHAMYTTGGIEVFASFLGWSLALLCCTVLPSASDSWFVS